jgi:hypothetical protein
MEQKTSTATMALGMHHRIADSMVLAGNDSEDWVVVEDKNGLGGAVLYADRTTGHVVCLSTRRCSDEDRWNEMPSLSQFPYLLVLDLHKSRYLTTLDDTIGDLKHIQRMMLTECKKLRTLPPTIGNLNHLIEVGFALFSS